MSVVILAPLFNYHCIYAMPIIISNECTGWAEIPAQIIISYISMIAPMCLYEHIL